MEFTGIRVGPAGWVEVELGMRPVKDTGVVMAHVDGGTVWVRMTRGEGGRLVIGELRILRPDTQALRRVPLSAIEHAVNLEPTRSLILDRAGEPAPDWGKRRTAFGKTILHQPRTRLTRPAGRPNDAFYQLVADAYRDAVRDGLKPKQTLIEDSGAPYGTVNTWVKEARRRGHLPPGRRGKVSA